MTEKIYPKGICLELDNIVSIVEGSWLNEIETLILCMNFIWSSDEINGELSITIGGISWRDRLGRFAMWCIVNREKNMLGGVRHYKVPIKEGFNIPNLDWERFSDLTQGTEISQFMKLFERLPQLNEIPYRKFLWGRDDYKKVFYPPRCETVIVDGKCVDRYHFYYMYD